MRIVLLFLWMLITHSSQIQAQTIQNDVVSAAGGSFTIGLNSIDWTMGETVIDFYSNSAKLHQGFHQVFTESLTASTEVLIPGAAIEVFPNPTTDFIEIQADQNLSDTHLSLVNSSGKVVLTKQLQEYDNRLSIQELPEGMYLLLLRTPVNQSVIKLIKTSN